MGKGRYRTFFRPDKLMKNILLYLWNKVLLVSNKIDYSTILVSSIPRESDVPPKTVVVVGHPKLPKWAIMKCPCGCNEILTLSLMKKHSPSWEVKKDGYNRISLSPSVWKTDGCRSHFFIKKGKIAWSKD